MFEQLIEVVQGDIIQVRDTITKEDGTDGYHRHVVTKDSDLSNESASVKAKAAELWGA